MSARAWRWRRNKPPVYLVHVDWWAAETLLNGPPPPARRVDLARRRRLERPARRRARLQGQRIAQAVEAPPWSYPDADVAGDVRGMFAASVHEFAGALDLSIEAATALSRAFFPLRRPIEETPPL